MKLKCCKQYSLSNNKFFPLLSLQPEAIIQTGNNMFLLVMRALEINWPPECRPSLELRKIFSV